MTRDRSRRASARRSAEWSGVAAVAGERASGAARLAERSAGWRRRRRASARPEQRGGERAAGRAERQQRASAAASAQVAGIGRLGVSPDGGMPKTAAAAIDAISSSTPDIVPSLDSIKSPSCHTPASRADLRPTLAAGVSGTGVARRVPRQLCRSSAHPPTGHLPPSSPLEAPPTALR
uniref:Uncharacterized protein n=1 Tax=Oryza meridionalis TaxID=40149 RepID=A0A0E0C2H8_9ORYZ